MRSVDIYCFVHVAPPQAILVSDWSIPKKSSPLKPLVQMNRNLVGSIYGMSSMKIAHFVPIGTFNRCFLPSFGSFVQAVSEEKIFKNWPIRGKDINQVSLLSYIIVFVTFSIFSSPCQRPSLGVRRLSCVNCSHFNLLLKTRRCYLQDCSG
jgi:hypothetical protein